MSNAESVAHPVGSVAEAARRGRNRTGPSVVRARPAPWVRATTAETVLQATLAAACALALVVGLAMTPSPTGVDTHTQLGLPPCGMLRMTGHPCPTCGVTTSFVLAAHGRFWDSLVNQPFGLTCFLLVAGGLAGLVVTLVSRRSWQPLFVRVHPLMILAVLLVILLVSWAYKWSIL